MKSMTGYGRATYTNENISIETEIRSVNSRFLELKISLPRELYFMEIELSKLVKKYINRGKVNVYINFEDKRVPEIELNETRLKAYWDIYQKALDVVEAKQNIPITKIISDNDIVRSKQCDLQSDEIHDAIVKNLEEALKAHDKMASIEGQSMLDFFEQSLNLMSENIDLIEAAIPPFKKEYFETLRANIKNILFDCAAKDDYRRLLQESALAVEKADVTEEIVRLRDHIAKFRQMMRKDVVNGKSLGFINQEMQREINTTGSKFGRTNVYPYILIVKEEVEKCKEMIANVR